jgi:hypothetical protein
MRNYFLILLAAVLALTACNQPTQTTTTTLEPMSFEWSGPLFE